MYYECVGNGKAKALDRSAAASSKKMIFSSLSHYYWYVALRTQVRDCTPNLSSKLAYSIWLMVMRP